MTGRRALYVNPVYTVGVEGMHREESAPTLAFLAEHMTAENFTCRFGWKQGALAIRDTRCRLHLPVSDYLGFWREMRRTAVKGEKPAFV